MRARTDFGDRPNPQHDLCDQCAILRQSVTIFCRFCEVTHGEDMAEADENLAQARRYLQTIESKADFEEIKKFLADGVVLETLPNRLLPRGSRDDLARMHTSAERGRKVMPGQKYEVKNALASGDQVALEVNWVGTLAVPYETIPAGGQMRARFAVFLQFRDGKIVAQRNYDCLKLW